MDELLIFSRYALTGIGATLIMDLYAVILKRVFSIPSLDFALVGRWVLHMPEGRWFHRSIATARQKPGEQPLGWFLHYAIGVVFALIFGAFARSDWITQPTALPAIIVGLLTIVFPFFVMQPAFGAGIAAARPPAPAQARLKSLSTHLIFGLGLWCSALALPQI